MFSDKAKDIRSRMRKYTTLSLVTECLRFLHDKSPIELEALRRPWIYSLILEWALELKPHNNAKHANSVAVRKLAQSLWDLQSDAVTLVSGRGYQIPIRKMLIPQIRFQTSHGERFVFLFRFAAMLLSERGSQAPKDDFNRLVGIDLEKFFVFSLWLQINFAHLNSSFVSYGTMLTKLYPYFSLDELNLLLRAVGGTLPELVLLAEEEKKPNRIIHPSEYFDEPLLIRKPIIILLNGISTPHLHILNIGISEFVLRTLKRAAPQRFRNKFSSIFEDYIHHLLNEYGITHIRESAIQAAYHNPNTQKKAVDFYVDEASRSLFIDAKGVEPKAEALTTESGRFIRDKLKDYHFKGLEQISECIQQLQCCNFESLSPLVGRFGLIVTHQDFYICDAATLLSFLEPKHSQALSKLLEAYVLPENIFFCTIADLESILKTCEKTKTTLCDFLDHCRIQQKSPQTRVFTINQHLSNYKNQSETEGIPIGSRATEKMKDRLFEQLIDIEEQNKTFWKTSSGDSPTNFVKIHERLMASLNI